MKGEKKEKTVLFISWKDIKNPVAGGAEIVQQELSKRMIQDGYKVIHLVPGFENCKEKEIVDDVEINRIGKSILYFPLLAYYFVKKYKKDTDYLVDVFNCFGSFSFLFFDSEKVVQIYYHIQGYVWFYQTHFHGVPKWIIKIFNFTGFFIEKIQVKLNSLLFSGNVITISKSTKNELVSYGFKRNKITSIILGTTFRSLNLITDSEKKEREFTIMLIGLRKMKRPMHTMRSFELFVKKVPTAKLWVVGWGTENENLKQYATKKGFGENVVFWGRVDEQKKQDLMQKAHVLCTSPVKEGWGLIVTEANAMATPVIGYDVPGLRDALSFGNGYLCKPNPQDMANKIYELYSLYTYKPNEYQQLREKCLRSSKDINFEKSYAQFKEILFLN
jgi:glycosyltransferase involved in cell wall biosynthesis